MKYTLSGFLILLLFSSLSFSQIKRKNLITIYYTNNSFAENYLPVQYLTAEYMRTFNKASIIARLNYTKKIFSQGLQAEADAYPVLGKKVYMYLNAGYSPDSVYPRYKLGSDIYASLPFAVELSAGFRFMKFYPDNILLPTVSVTKYISNFIISSRIYFNFSSDNKFTALTLSTRQYFTDTDFAGITLGYGSVPENPGTDDFSQSSAQNLLKTFSVFMEYSKMFIRTYLLKAGAGYENEEISAGKHRNKFILFCGIGLIF